MRSWFGHSALLVAVIGGLVLAALEQPDVDAAVAPYADPAAVLSADWSPSHLRPIFADDVFGDEATGSIDRFAITQVLPLSDEQRGLVFLGVMNLPDIPEVELEARDLTVPLPQAVELQDLPMMVTRKVPLLDAHKFVKLGDRILVVNPNSRAIVSQIPRYRVVLQ
jgi:hypothetical protein